MNELDFYSEQYSQVLVVLRSRLSGLTAGEVQSRLAEEGPNEIKIKRRNPIIAAVIEPFKSLFIIVLLVAAGISFYLHKNLEAAAILLIILINAVIFYIQQYAADRALQALTKKDIRRVKAIRDGKVSSVKTVNLVTGDIVLLGEGMKVPADGRLVESDNLMLDESMLTGESLPVAKNVEPVKAGSQIYDQRNMVFQGTIITGGSGKCVITATANDTELARIAELSKEEAQDSPLQRKINRLTKSIVLAVLVIAGLAFWLGIYRGQAPVEMLRLALSLTVSAVPESLPVALTIVLVLAVKRMAHKKALVRNLKAVETLGQTTLIATDKTGTITKNQLTIAHTWHPSDRQLELERAAWLATASKDKHADDPLEKVVIEELAMRPPAHWHKVKVIPFNQKLRLSGAVWQTPDGYQTFIKGAPEIIIKALAKAAKATKATATRAHQIIKQLTAQGYRLIGFASFAGKTIPENDHALLKAHLKLEGILAFSDQLRGRIPEAIEQTKQAGIQVVMLTGDHLETAKSFGLQAGIINKAAQSSHGAALAKLDPPAIRQLLKEVQVFARVLPEHKYQILKAVGNHEITAMTGDGINDVPAIVKADVGIAMGRGTDAAKEASDMILLDNHYGTIVEAIKEGRTVLANVRKMVFYLFATNLGEILTMLGALILNLPLPLTALQILWINLVTDSLTVIPLGLEPAEQQHMKMPPEGLKSKLLRRHMVWRVGLTAALMAVLSLVVFWLYLPSGILAAQTMAFATLIVVQWANVLNARSEHASFLEGFRRPNYLLWLAILASAAVQGLVFWGPLQGVLGVTGLGGRELLLLLAATLVVFTGGDLLKKIFK